MKEKVFMEKNFEYHNQKSEVRGKMQTFQLLSNYYQPRLLHAMKLPFSKDSALKICSDTGKLREPVTSITTLKWLRVSEG